MPTTFSYVNNFNLNVGTASSSTTGSGVGIAQGSNTDTDREYVFFSGRDEGATLDLNANTAAGDRINQFSASMQLDFWAINAGSFGNGNPDGFSFNYGNPATLTASREYGLSTGLSIRVLPFDWSTNGSAISILWNNQVIGTTPLTGFTLNNPAATLSIGVNTAGQVTVQWGTYSVAGTIPGNQWLTTGQSGWDFILSGRTGSNGDGAYIDDLSVTGTVVCFAAGTGILTDRGEVRVEKLRAGDLVRTRDHGQQVLRWVSSRTLSAAQLAANPRLRPIRIAKGALGCGLPAADMRLSPQHRILARSPVSTRMFGNAEVLIAARNLLTLPGIEIDESDEPVTYCHLLFDRHEIVFANGAPAESLLIAPGALNALSPLHIGEIVENLPAVLDPAFNPTPARDIPDTSRQKKLVERLRRNAQAVCA